MLDDNWTSHSIEFLRQLMGAAEVHCRIIGERRDVPKYIVEAVTVTTTEYRRATAGGEPTPS